MSAEELDALTEQIHAVVLKELRGKHVHFVLLVHDPVSGDITAGGNLPREAVRLLMSHTVDTLEIEPAFTVLDLGDAKVLS